MFALNSKTEDAQGEALLSLRRHGGRLSAADAAFPSAVKPWLDLSTGVNPHAWSGPALTSADMARLPDPEDIAALEATAARAFGASPERVAAVPGSDAALRLLPYILNASRVGIVSPTYSGHAEASRAAGKHVTPISRADLQNADQDVVVLVNPNNPDGAVIAAAEVRALVQRQQARQSWLVVDEAFADATPDISVAADAGEGLIVLRSFGKFYGLPGLRLGFVIADKNIAAKIRAVFGDWPVNAVAVSAACAAYADVAWQRQTSTRIALEAQALERLLTGAGFDIVGGTSLFRLAAHRRAGTCFQALAGQGILVRAFDDQPSWLRFGLPGASGWNRLRDALEVCMP